jgi:hypothetical protein
MLTPSCPQPRVRTDSADLRNEGNTDCFLKEDEEEEDEEIRDEPWRKGRR